jgi:hypothetical protein
VEEAQGMPLATLEEIRLLSNLETKHDKLLQIVLFGQPELDENLNQTNIRQLRERITHSFNLAPLQTKEIGEYLIFRLRAAGYFGPHLFTNAAISKIAASAEGLVRRVNILADKALLAAFADNEYQVTPKHVQAAIGDSEFGVEASKKQAKKSQMFMWAGLLALGLALGYAASMWSQKQAILKESKPEIETAESLPKAAEVNKNAITAAPIAPAQASMQPNNGAPPSPASITAPTQTDDILTRRLNATTTWLASQAPTTVSIQLMGVSSETQLKYDLEALSQQIEIDNIYVYRTKVNSLPFLTVLYGSFPSRVQAIQALRKLPVEIQKNRPQLRTIAGVLQETK